jgi:hypothetical protein
VLNKFVSGLQTHSNAELRESLCRSARSLSCPPMGARIVPFASSTIDSATSERSPDLPQIQQPSLQEDHHVRIVPSLLTKSRPYNHGDTWRQPLGQEEGQDTRQNVQITTCDAPLQPLNEKLVNISPDHSDSDAEVSEDNDFSAPIDFLATLRQIDPQRALELERQYDADIAELIHGDKREAVSKDTATMQSSI